jgi:SAM-dependent methyltransferase
MALLRSFVRLWKLRNSIESADYDERAFYSAIPFQRWWQRRRHRIVCQFARGAGKTLDAGCGSSIILQSLNNAIGMDILPSRLRYMRRYNVPLMCASVNALPVRDASFDCVISSQVIEHVPYDEAIFAELNRVLRPRGLLVLGTPDYDTIGWRTIEPIYGRLAPGGYKDEHITHYTRNSLTDICRRFGFDVENTAYVFRSELILALRKRREADQTTAPIEPAVAAEGMRPAPETVG